MARALQRQVLGEPLQLLHHLPKIASLLHKAACLQCGRAGEMSAASQPRSGVPASQLSGFLVEIVRQDGVKGFIFCLWGWGEFENSSVHSSACSTALKLRF